MVHDVLEALNKSGFTEYKKEIEDLVQKILINNNKKNEKKKQNKVEENLEKENNNKENDNNNNKEKSIFADFINRNKNKSLFGDIANTDNTKSLFNNQNDEKNEKKHSNFKKSGPFAFTSYKGSNFDKIKNEWEDMDNYFKARYNKNSFTNTFLLRKINNDYERKENYLNSCTTSNQILKSTNIYL